MCVADCTRSGYQRSPHATHQGLPLLREVTVATRAGYCHRSSRATCNSLVRVSDTGRAAYPVARTGSVTLDTRGAGIAKPHCPPDIGPEPCFCAREEAAEATPPRKHSAGSTEADNVCGGPGPGIGRRTSQNPGDRAKKPSRLEDCGYPTGKVDSPGLGCRSQRAEEKR